MMPPWSRFSIVAEFHGVIPFEPIKRNLLFVHLPQ
jgi:hypothetical protein